MNPPGVYDKLPHQKPAARGRIQSQSLFSAMGALWRSVSDFNAANAAELIAGLLPEGCDWREAERALCMSRDNLPK